MDDLISVAGRRVVITGAGRGLGRALATAFDAAGAQLALVARSASAIEEVAGSLAGDPVVCAGDVRDERFNESVGDQMLSRFGGVDVWIANAGVSAEAASVTGMSADAWREVIDVNLTGTFLGARAAAGRMGAGGRIIVTGSVLGDRPHGRLAAYSASKGGVNALVRVARAGARTARDHGQRGRAGLVRDRARGLLAPQRDPQGGHRRAHRARPLGNAGGPGRRLPVPRVGGLGLHHRHHDHR